MATRILYNELYHSSPELGNRFDSIFNESLNIWNEQYLRQFTVHGRQHTEQVERNLDSITRPLQNSEEKLTPEEIFILLSACCLHDIGMQLADDPDARMRHAQLAYELVLNSYARDDSEEDRRIMLPVDDPNSRRAIALIARAHWTNFAVQLPREDYIVGAQRGRLKLLGALLATADLLDISPVRARYYRSIHRLYNLSPLSDLHQRMHSLVRGFQIVVANPAISSDLQFQLEWRDNSETVRSLNEWIMRWFDSQWRLLERVLFEESRSTIKWLKPNWASVKFNRPEGPIPSLPPASLEILWAEIIEQKRIDRNDFVGNFQTAIEQIQPTLFRFPKDSEYDGRIIAEWCESRAKLYENCRVARVVIPSTEPMEISSIIAELMEQWGQHLPTCNDDEALSRLENYISANQDFRFVSIIVSDDYNEDKLRPVLKRLLPSPNSDSAGSKICLLLAAGGAGPNVLDGVSVIVSGAEPFSQADVISYLQNRLGYSDQESQLIYERLSRIGFADLPGQIYNYLEIHCGISSAVTYL